MRIRADFFARLQAGFEVMPVGVPLASTCALSQVASFLIQILSSSSSSSKQGNRPALPWRCVANIPALPEERLGANSRRATRSTAVRRSAQRPGLVRCTQHAPREHY
jgi:hypothetical protein